MLLTLPSTALLGLLLAALTPADARADGQCVLGKLDAMNNYTSCVLGLGKKHQKEKKKRRKGCLADKDEKSKKNGNKVNRDLQWDVLPTDGQSEIAATHKKSSSSSEVNTDVCLADITEDVSDSMSSLCVAGKFSEWHCEDLAAKYFELVTEADLNPDPTEDSANCFAPLTHGWAFALDGTAYGSLEIHVGGLCGDITVVKSRLEDGMQSYLQQRFECGGIGVISSVTLTHWKEGELCGGNVPLSRGKLNFVAQLNRGEGEISFISSQSDILDGAQTTQEWGCDEEAACEQGIFLVDEIKNQVGFGMVDSAKITQVSVADCSIESGSCLDDNGICCGAPSCGCKVLSKSLCESHECCVLPEDPGFCYGVGDCGTNLCQQLERVNVTLSYLEYSTEPELCIESREEDVETQRLKDVFEEFFLNTDGEETWYINIEALPQCTTNAIDAGARRLGITEAKDDGNTTQPAIAFGRLMPDFDYDQIQTTDLEAERQLQSSKKKKASSSSCSGCNKKKRRRLDLQVTCDPNVENYFACLLNESGFSVENAELDVVSEETISTSIPKDLIDLLCDSLHSEESCENLSIASTPQFKAVLWLYSDPLLNDRTDEMKKQMFALSVLFWTTGGLQQHGGWGDHFVPVCSWEYIVCNDDGQIIEMNMPEVLAGEGYLPAELSLLDKLQKMILYGNNLIGTIPTEFGADGAFPDLQEIRLRFNDLDGEIPSELGRLLQLEVLELWNNKITGAIPTELGNLQRLSFLDLAANEINGGIPTEVGNLLSLERLYLEENNLEGEIPTQIWDLPNLTVFFYNSNDLTGSVPEEVCERVQDFSELFLQGDFGCYFTPGQDFECLLDCRRVELQCFRLTEAWFRQRGYFWGPYKFDLTSPFEIETEMYYGEFDGDGADGMAFVLQDQSQTLVGGAGGGFGYRDIDKSFAIEFDTWYNGKPSDTIVEDHMAFLTNGNLEAMCGLTPSLGNIEDGKKHKVDLVWNPDSRQMAVFYEADDATISLQMTVNLEKIIESQEAFWGFTASTGGRFNEHQVCIKNVKFGSDVRQLIGEYEDPDAIFECPGSNVEREELVCGETVDGDTTFAPVYDYYGCGIYSTAGGIWYELTGVSGRVTISTCHARTNFDTTLRVFQKGTDVSVFCEANDDSSCSFGSLKSAVTFDAEPSETYEILVAGYSSGFGQFKLSTHCEPPPSFSFPTRRRQVRRRSRRRFHQRRSVRRG